METQAQTSKSPHPLVWVAAIALIVFCGAGIAALMGWIPTSLGKPDEAVLTQAAPPAQVVAPAKVAAAPAAAKVDPQLARDRARDQARDEARDERARERARDQARDERARDRARANAPAVVAAVAKCAECGVVQSVREIDTKGAGSGVGVVGGAVVGGVLGNQVGDGSGRRIATVIGAVGGAVAGNEIEKHVKTTKSYEITVRFDDGSSRVFTEANATTWRSGDKVKILNGAIQSNA
jgi:outer membrane lipoprotein SlyB